MSEQAFKLSEMLQQLLKLPVTDANNLVAGIEKVRDAHYLNQDDKMDIIKRIDEVKSEVSGNVWKGVGIVVGATLTLIGTATGIILHFIK